MRFSASETPMGMRGMTLEPSRGNGQALARLVLVVQLVAALLLSGCRSEMYDQPRYKPYHASDFFDDGSSARPLVAGTVARPDPNARGKASAEHFDTGKV